MADMRNRPLALNDTRDEDDDVLLSRLRHHSINAEEERNRQKTKLDEEEHNRNQNKRKAAEDLEDSVEKGRRSSVKKEIHQSAEEDGGEEVQEEAKPVGDVVRVSGKGPDSRNHYKSFEHEGINYELEDPVMLVPEKAFQKPYVAIIKDISQTSNGSLMVTGQWLYRPEEAEKKTGGNWESNNTRELFYSFHRDEVPAESVMHKCVVHFIPLNKQIPHRKQHPGFIVQKVYDAEQMKLYRLTDKDYEDSKQSEIDLLVQKTISLIGDLPQIEQPDPPCKPEGGELLLKSKRLMRKQSMPPLDVSRMVEAPSPSPTPTPSRSSPYLKAQTPGSCASNSSEYYTILKKFNVLTRYSHRNKWLEKLLQSIQFMCDGELKFQWPDSYVEAVVSLERAAHESLSTDFQKYNQKMRQLVFNLKNNAALARRLLNGELKASQVSTMSPTELKEGLTSEEIAIMQPEEQETVQMTNARCRRCSEKQVRLMDIIQAGYRDRYHLECRACGNNWYGNRDEAAILTIGGTEAQATEEIEKQPEEDKEDEDEEEEPVIFLRSQHRNNAKP